MDILEELKKLFRQKDVKENPLVCFITNHVTELDLVDACIYSGGSPVLTDELEETIEMVDYAGVNSIMINTGTINNYYLNIMLNMGRAANKAKVPIILDPAAMSASPFRERAMKRILEEVNISVIKGNLGEIKRMLGYAAKSKGIDSFEEEQDALRYCLELAEKTKAIIVMTGAVDIITDGKRVISLANGTPMLKKVCGAGSTIGAVIATFSGYTCDYFLSSVLGTAIVGIAGERAELKCGKAVGMRNFKQAFQDEISTMTEDILQRGIKIKEKTL